VVCFSGYTDNLRAQALSDGLRRVGWQVTDSRGRGRRSTPWELLATLVPNCWLALRTPADVALGCKPHPNVTLPLMICRWRGIKTWLDVDDLDHAYRRGPAAWIVDRLQRPHPRRADVVTYHHPRLRTHLVDRLGCAPERVMAVPQGVHVARFARARAPLAVHDGRPRAVFAAHLNLACDLEIVLAAWPQVLARRPDAVLTVVGGGARLGEFRRRVRDQGLAGSVALTGEVRPAEVPAYLAGADVAVAWASDRLVNRHRCSLKLREYLAAGLPVVCNDVGELADFAAVTYQVRDIDHLPDELVRLLDGQGDARETAGRHLAQSLDWHPIITTAATQITRRLHLPLPPTPTSADPAEAPAGAPAPTADAPPAAHPSPNPPPASVPVTLTPTRRQQ
jgi:glycosyltransferase involved in cell wall biosynthesis